MGDNGYVPLGCSVVALSDCEGFKPLLIETSKNGILHELPAKKSSRAITNFGISLKNTKEL